MSSVRTVFILSIAWTVVACSEDVVSETGDSETDVELEPIVPAYGANTVAYEGTGIAALIDSGWSGAGVRVCVVDTGVDPDHPAFTRSFARDAVSWVDLTVEASPTPIDTNGHGTHVAGIIAMNDELTGGAPNVDLLIARVFTADGGADFATIGAAVDWCREGGADVISMSLGGLTFPAIEELLQEDPTATEDAVERAIREGIYVVAAAGNTEASRDVATPAGIPSVIAVGALNADLQSKAAFSQSGLNEGPLVETRTDPDKKPEVSAPGVTITSAIAADSTITVDVSDCANTLYCPLNGTSQATPFVAAALALVLEAKPEYQHENISGDPLDTVARLKIALSESADPRPNQTEPHDDGVGYGMIRADLLLEAL
ncbi:MAG: S8 family serine peptidase [Myxococcota bacterium]